ncbi:MAG: hypothetical protein A3D64_02755 [Candidatus Wildermuthbacteria bacterium RIFCSPHIGHO2_02_FULL_49_9]|uniref:Small ribosomal subunit protein bS6 n=2 Tax=Candidatus Wildermuthiibacteriota TaxID=1817923 RepID=A0A1G2QZH5_9BACT|nr:MAG: hypothetical protein A2672_00095 [Candidatus Wildermuthbacteria bacterium RIFCSPHIGHO2_01_FULL_49_22b]OHA70498.1 MAG: hypothetical protein A3D64_02755 [Candidatus Wildermuthbacteria bacterium RIFCSPHIGHO2_02_FULL_49_9]
MRNYELALLLKVGVNESELQEFLGETTSLLQDAGALIMSQENKGKRFLLSPVKKHREAELAVVRFTLDPARLEGVAKNLKDKEKILRFILLSYLPRKARELTMAKAAAVPAHQENLEEHRVEIEDIDKKLEEIFKDENL